MPLAMNLNPFITCAVTGSGGTQDRSPHVPRTPEQIAASAIDAAKAGAAVVHCHVRDPDTGAPCRRTDLFREVVDRIRDSDTDVVVNLTAGMGGDMVFGDVENPLPLNEAGTDMAGATERVAHVAESLPEICTLDCGTMNFAEADYVMTNTPGMLRAMGQMMTDLGVRPEIEVFETGHLWFAKKLVEEGKVKYVGLSECSAETLRRAHKIHPVTCIQMEYSLWCRGIEKEVLPTCKELGIGLVAYSPLGRGFFGGAHKTDLAKDDFRNNQERFKQEENHKMYEKVEEIAKKKGATPAQLALAWVQAQQHRAAGVVAIPGTTKEKNLLSNVNSLKIDLTKDEIAALEAAVPAEQGARYSDSDGKGFEDDKNPPLLPEEAKALGL